MRLVWELVGSMSECEGGGARDVLLGGGAHHDDRLFPTCDRG